MSKLLTAETFYDERNVRDLGVPVALWANYLYPASDSVLPVGDALSPSVAAFVNGGRWMVQCPFDCGSAQVASETDHRFYCTGLGGCQNYAVENYTIPVIWPEADEQAAIEELLIVRPTPFRNWFPWESLTQLTTENTVRGQVI